MENCNNCEEKEATHEVATNENGSEVWYKFCDDCTRAFQWGQQNPTVAPAVGITN